MPYYFGNVLIYDYRRNPFTRFFGTASISYQYSELAILTKASIDLLAIQQKSLDRALSLYSFINVIRSSGVRASITIVYIRRFYKMWQSIVRLRFFSRIAERSIKK